MVFIIDSGLTEEQIPSFIECTLLDKKGAPMLLRLHGAKVTAIFVAEHSKVELLQSPLITKSIKDRFTYFKNDTELLKMLNSTNADEVEHPDTSNVEDGVQQQANSEVSKSEQTTNDIVTNEVSKSEQVNNVVQQTSENGVQYDGRPISTIKKLPEDVITEVDDSSFVLGIEYTVPEVGYNDTDSMVERLEVKERQLAQYKVMMQEKVEEYEKLIEEQDNAALTLQKMYEDKLNEASVAFNKLKSDYALIQGTAGKYHVYAQKSRALLSEGFAPNDKEQILNTGLDLRVMATSGDIANMLFMLKYNMGTSDMGYTIIDLSGTAFFQMMKMVKNNLAMGLFQSLSDEDIEQFKANIDVVNGNQIIAASAYHDIALLESDWVTFFNNVKKIFGDSKVLLILGDISSFSVLYTLSKLATVSKAYLHIRCSILGLQFAYSRLAFVPQIRGIRWVATHYFDKVAPIVQDIGKHYAIKTSVDNMLLSEIEDM